MFQKVFDKNLDGNYGITDSVRYGVNSGPGLAVSVVISSIKKFGG